MKRWTAVILLLLIGSLSGCDLLFPGLLDNWFPGFPDSSLVAYYDFDGAGTTILPDNSQYVNNGDIQQISGVVAGKVGNAFSFDGINDWVSVPDSESLRTTTRLTVDCWVKPRTLPAAGKPSSTGIAAFGKDEQGMWELRLMGDGAIYLLLNWNSVSSAEVVSSPQLTVNTWHHVTATFDGASARLYVDGVLSGEGACPELVYPGEGSFLAIGVDFPGSDEYFDGLIDELRIYNRVVAP